MKKAQVDNKSDIAYIARAYIMRNKALLRTEERSSSRRMSQGGGIASLLQQRATEQMENEAEQPEEMKLSIQQFVDLYIENEPDDNKLSPTHLRLLLGKWSVIYRNKRQLRKDGEVIAEKVTDPLRPNFPGVWTVCKPAALVRMVRDRPRVGRTPKTGVGGEVTASAHSQRRRRQREAAEAQTPKVRKKRSKKKSAKTD